MIEFLFQPESVTYLALMILTMSILGYLLSIKNKSEATWWMATLVTGFWLYWVRVFLMNSLSPEILSIPLIRNIVHSLILLANGFTFFPFMMFAYHFMENPFPKEAVILKWFFGVLVVLNISFLIYYTFAGFGGAPGALNMVVASTVIILGTVVLIRKYLRARKKGDLQQKHAYRNYGLVSVIMILYIGSFFIQTYTGLRIPYFNIVVNTLLLLFTFGLTLIYINYSSELTSFQVKLIGLSLVTVIALFSIVPPAIFTEEKLQAFQPEIEHYEFLKFTSVENNAYAIDKGSALIDPEVYGMSLQLTDDKAKAIALPFQFPFASQQWDSLFVSPNGLVSFGGPIYGNNDPVFSNQFVYNSLPKIAPLYYDFDPSEKGTVFFYSDSASATITWHKVPSFQAKDDSSTFQLILSKNGDIRFNYGSVSSHLLSYLIMRGIIPGNSEKLSSQKLPNFLHANQPWFEYLQVEYRKNLDPIFRSFINFLIVFSAFILVIFPFFYRNSLIDPINRLLEGVQKINKGNLETQVKVDVHDEIGHLTKNFNSMADSLKRYQDEMEDLVAERTAKLEQSLKELKATQNQLIQQEKLASLGQLTAGIAHEIKNPLNFVNNFSDLSVELVEEVRDELSDIRPQTSDSGDAAAAVAEALDILDDVETNLNKINEHGSRADGIVKSMLQHSRGGDGEMEPTDLNALIKEYVNLAFHGMRASENPINVDIEMELDENVGKIPLIAEDFSRVIINLCNNAFDAMRKKQEAGSYEPKLTVRTNQNGGNVTIEVEDNGPGIPEEVRDKILQPFFTTKKGTEGTGLGLSITNDIVKAHGGKLKIHSNDNGSVFRIQLNKK